MVNAAWTGADDADVALLLVDARAGFTDGVKAIAERLGAANRPTWLALNKVDITDRQSLLPLTESLNALATFARVFMISAQTGDGVQDLFDAMAQAMPEGPHLYPDDDLTDLPDRLLAAEMVREQVFLQTHEEVPYGTTVETESFTERPDGSVRIDATIYVARAGQKAILIGEKGARIKSIGARARAALAQVLDRQVHLFLNVKERSGWDEERARLRAIGLDDPD
jgi:GTP-binding protein Era